MTAEQAQRVERLARSARQAFVPAALQLRDALQAELLATDVAPLLRALQDMHHAVADADADARRTRWLPWLGGSRSTARRFQFDCREALATRAPVAQRAERLARAHRRQAVDAAHHLDRLREFSDRLAVAVMEAQALLAALWDGLRPQWPARDDRDSLEGMRALLAEVDGHRAAVQRLDSACAAGQDVVRLGRAVLRGREEALALLDAQFERHWSDWRHILEPAVAEGVSPSQALAGARRGAAARHALLAMIDQVRGACTRLQIDEQALAQALAHLHEQLAALG
ncbi:MAG: hypothetical protein ACXWC2_09105 [Ramlibacter sp.]